MHFGAQSYTVQQYVQIADTSSAHKYKYQYNSTSATEITKLPTTCTRCGIAVASSSYILAHSPEDQKKWTTKEHSVIAESAGSPFSKNVVGDLELRHHACLAQGYHSLAALTPPAEQQADSKNQHQHTTAQRKGHTGGKSKHSGGAKNQKKKGEKNSSSDRINNKKKAAATG